MRQQAWWGPRGVGAALLAVAISLLSPVGPAQAADETSVTVTSGTLGVAAPAVNDFAVITLTGSAQAADALLEPFSVTDARGTGEGWRLSMEATPFREWDGTAYVIGGRSLPAGSLSLPGVTVANDGTESVGPKVLPGPYILDSGTISVATAAAGTGMGRFTVSPTDGLRVAVPAGAYARTYRSELAVSVTSGP